jgi:hypothetical protein
MLLETEGWEVDSGAEHLGFSKNTDTPDSINLHLHIWVAIWISKVSQVRSPRGILCISLNNDSVLIKGVGEGEGGF